jgi:glycosyltransferase involved in cell wall biosynthesis
VIFFDAYPHMYAGTARSVHLLAQRLPDLGYTAEVVLPQDGTVADHLRATDVAVSVVAVPPSLGHYGRHTRGLTRLRALFALPVYWWRLRRHLRSRPGVVYVTSHRSVILAAPAARLARVPVLWLISGIEDDRGVSVLCNLLATRTIACSPAASASLPFGRRRAPHTVVPFPLDPRFDDPPVARPQQPPIVVTVGRLEPIKDHPALLEAFAIVRRQVPGVRLRIVGGAQEGHEEYAQRVRRMVDALDGSAELAGWSDNPEGLMLEASVYVCSSRREGMGISIIEAMACGLPAVMTADTGLSGFLEHEHSALIVPNGDVEALARAIIRLLDDAPFARTVAEAGQHAVRMFSLDHVASATSAVLDEMVPAEPAVP